MSRINLRLRQLVALSLIAAAPLTALAGGGSIRFEGRIVDPTCTIRAGDAGDRNLNCHTEQLVQVRVTPVCENVAGSALTLDEKPLKNAQLVTHRLQADKNVTLSAQPVPVQASNAQTPQSNAVIVMFSYL